MVFLREETNIPGDKTELDESDSRKSELLSLCLKCCGINCGCDVLPKVH